MAIYFTSDLHFHHNNIIKYCNRPFADVEEMNYKLIAEWNKKVSADDTVYILGDIFLCTKAPAISIASQLNGHKNLVLGNHDELIRKTNTDNTNSTNLCITDYFNILPALHETVIDKITVVMSHYPLLSWNKASRGSMMLHGHVHSIVPHDGISRRYDVGVDANNYAPVSWDHIKKQLLKIEPFDSRRRE